MNELLLYIVAWMNLTSTTLNRIRHKYNMILFKAGNTKLHCLGLFYYRQN